MASYPQVNKNAYSFCSIELVINGATIVGVQSVNYKMSLKPGIVRGASARKNGRTLGTYEPTASMTLYKQDADDLLFSLGDGFGMKVFDIVIHFAEEGQPISTVNIVGCRITEVGEDNKEGEEPTTNTFELDVMDIITNDISIIPQNRS